MSRYAVYGDYSYTFFDLDPVDDHRAVDSGFSVGLARAFPLARRVYEPWVAADLLVHEMKVTGTADSRGDGRLGYEVGGGVAVPLTHGFRATYGVGYRRYEARIQRPERESVSYLSLEVGINRSF